MIAAGSSASRAILRFIALAPVPPVLGIGLIWLFWVFAYVSIPVFFPFLAYAEACSPIGIRGAPTIFHETGWYWSAAYLVLIVGTTAAVTFRQSYVLSLAALVPITILYGAITHGVLYLLGFCYWLDSP
jgi:hypothetical protein